MSFSKLLRTSKFASLEGQIKPLISSSNGYGLKYNLNKSSIIEPSEIDTGYSFFRYKEHEASNYEILRDIFPENAKCDSKIVDIAEMPENEWKELVNKLKNDQKLRDAIKTDDSKLNLKYILEYAGFKPSESIKVTNGLQVKGRVLNPVKGGFVIGVYGITAWLPAMPPQFMHIPGWDNNDRTKLYDFYVEEIGFSEIGMPWMNVSLRKPVFKKESVRVEQQKEDTLSKLLDEMAKTPVKFPRKDNVGSSSKFLGKLSDLLKDVGTDSSKRDKK